MPHVRKLPSGRWRAEVRDPGGRRYGKTFTLKGQAGAWATEEEAKIRRGAYVDPRQAKQPVRELVERWWAGRVVERTTEASDRGRIDLYVLPQWGDWPIEAVRPSSVQQWIVALGRGGLSAWSVRRCVNLLSAALDTARIDGLIMSNPCRDVQLPTPPPGREVFLTQVEVERVADAMDRRPVAADFDRAVLLVASYSGMRWGELSGLRRHRVDMLRRRIEVVETMTEINGRFETKPYPKSGRARTIPIPDRIEYVLSEHMAKYPGGPDDLLFVPASLGYHWGRGLALSRHRWPRLALKPAVELATGRTDVTVHDLRRSYGSWLAQAGLSLHEIAGLLGHSSTDATRIYARFGPDHFDRALAALSRRSTTG